MIRRYHHVSITVSDMEKSIRFYRDLLGFTVLGTFDSEGEEVSLSLA